MNNPNQIAKIEVTAFNTIDVTLENNVKLTLVSNQGYFHIHLSNFQGELEIVDLAANQFNVEYQTP